MTIEELSQLYNLNREIELDKSRLADLETGKSYIGGLNFSASHGSEPSDKTGRIAAEIADLKAIIIAKIEQSIHERSRLERYIAGINDSLTRRIFTLRFINGLSWIQVALEIGGGNTDDSCRMICMRYLKKQK